MNDPFAALARPLVSRPGDPPPPRVDPVRAPKRQRKRRREFDFVPNPWHMTAMECAVAALLVDGMSATAAAESLCISNKTFATYVSRIKEKMGAKNTTHVALTWDRLMRGQIAMPAPDVPRDVLAAEVAALRQDLAALRGDLFAELLKQQTSEAAALL